MFFSDISHSPIILIIWLIWCFLRIMILLDVVCRSTPLLKGCFLDIAKTSRDTLYAILVKLRPVINICFGGIGFPWEAINVRLTQWHNWNSKESWKDSELHSKKAFLHLELRKNHSFTTLQLNPAGLEIFNPLLIKCWVVCFWNFEDDLENGLVTRVRILSCWVSWSFNGRLKSVDSICNPWIELATDGLRFPRIEKRRQKSRAPSKPNLLKLAPSCVCFGPL